MPKVLLKNQFEAQKKMMVYLKKNFLSQKQKNPSEDRLLFLKIFL
jgi:hypothetical protein